jgi:transcriptional regulator with XRE-family HTH domain
MADIHPIKKLRDAGYTHKTVGAAVGVSAQTVWRWEHGKRAPRKPHRIKLKDLFNIDPGELIKFHDEAAA